jgi:hypothetical protein
MGILSVALLMAVGFTGVGVSYWSETLDMSATVETGTYGSELSPGTPEPEANVSCIIDGNTLNITITDATVGWYYYRNFDIHNNGTVPIKIESISISAPSEVTATVSDVHVDDVIEGGGTSFGTVNMEVTEAGDYYDLQVTIDTILWNQ